MGTVALTGCLGGGERSDPTDDTVEFETCNRRVIWYHNLPDDVKEEVDTALAEERT